MLHRIPASSKLSWFVACFAAFTNGAIQAQDSSDSQSALVVSSIAILQDARKAGLPEMFGPMGDNSKAYQAVQSLATAIVNKPQAANELVEWLFVSGPTPNSFQPRFEALLHPAGIALVAIGGEAIAPLKAKLNTVTSERDTILILRCLRHIYKDGYKAQLLQLKSDTSSVLLNKAIDRVANEEREEIGVTLEPEN